MKNSVILKGNRYGLSIVLDDKAEFSQLIEDLIVRLENAESFFDSKKQLAVTFEGRTLTNEELDQILTVIEDNSKLNIQYVMDEDSELEATFFDIIHSEEEKQTVKEEQLSFDTDIIQDEDIIQRNSDLTEMIPLFSEERKDNLVLKNNLQETDSTGMFYKGTLRSGQSLEAKESLVIIGDVNPGATVIAGGNIIIIGSLKGSAVAGVNGNSMAFVMALAMNPMQIQIADVIARNPDGKHRLKLQKEGMIARLLFGRIVMEPISKVIW